MSEAGVVDERRELEVLLDSSYPLLHNFREACPGTYKHSQALLSMIEGIALSLGLCINLMKVCAMYHDIGKSFSPKYFTENQPVDEDTHNKLDATVSYSIITRHVSDSVIILINEPNFPRDVIEIISQHHGTSILKYFYKKAEIDDEKFFRYKTTRPTCIESAVLMICDRVEATSRSRIQNSSFDATEVIESTVSSLLDDGQLDAVYMKLGDLKKIKEALYKELEGMYQKRIKYPDDIYNKKEEEVDNG